MQAFRILIICAPSGEITFMSKCFLGGTPDGTIVIKSGLLKLMEWGDDLLADKGEILVLESLTN